ncbi:MAG: response regulator transcription factor [Cellulosilyticum sp.]|nr:response regulator transcription factor [Cellulosilyticum sp.]
MKLLIVDDHEIVRKGLIDVLALDEEFDEILEASNIEEALKILRLSKPDIAIVDICLRNKENGFRIIEKSLLENMDTKFVVFTSSSRKNDYDHAKALNICGYILKDSYIEDINYALKDILKGKSFFDRSIQESTMRDVHKEVREALTDREYEVLKALGKGLTNQQIAQKFYITENTVKKHISSLLSKLELAHRTEAALYAAKMWRRADD